MYLARFSYSFKPIDRERAMALLAREVAAARQQGMEARLLVPLTRPAGGPALQYELVMNSLDDFEAFRERGVGGEDGTRAWLRDLSSLLVEPPAVELLRIAEEPEDSQAWQEEQPI
ncbi:MAG TPA: hypothetical protein VIL01_13400 [Thermomicrobiales bacterium]